MFHECFKEVLSCFKEVLRAFQGGFKGGSGKIGGGGGDLRVSKRSSKGVNPNQAGVSESLINIVV